VAVSGFEGGRMGRGFVNGGIGDVNLIENVVNEVQVIV